MSPTAVTTYSRRLLSIHAPQLQSLNADHFTYLPCRYDVRPKPIFRGQGGNPPTEEKPSNADCWHAAPNCGKLGLVSFESSVDTTFIKPLVFPNLRRDCESHHHGLPPIFAGTYTDMFPSREDVNSSDPANIDGHPRRGLGHPTVCGMPSAADCNGYILGQMPPEHFQEG